MKTPSKHLKTLGALSKIVCISTLGGALETELDRPKCPSCGRRNIIYRIKTNSFMCRVCGHVWEKPNQSPKPEAPK